MEYTPKIVVCDSGISKLFQKNIKSIDIGYGVYDENGHGSAVIEIINRYTFSSMTSIRILDSECNCTLEALYQALIRCSKMDADIICLALALESDSDIPEIEEILREIADQGKIIVASSHNRRTHSYPAEYKEVIGVQNLYLKNMELPFFDNETGVQISVNLPPLLLGRPNEVAVFLTGSSLACGVITAHISDLFSKKGKMPLESLKKILAGQTAENIIFIRQREYFESLNAEIDITGFEKFCAVLEQFGFSDRRPIYEQIDEMDKLLWLIYQAMETDDSQSFGIPLSKDDMKSFEKLYEFKIKQECI